MHYHIWRLASILLFFLIVQIEYSYSQDEYSQDSTENVQKQLGLAATIASHALGADGVEYDTLLQNVKITQDSFFLFCDTAYIENKSKVQAIGNVAIQQGDSIQIFSDSLYYNEALKLAELYGRVIFSKGNQKLNTEKATYDINNKIAFYEEGATLLNSNQKLISEKGVYDIENDLASFKEKVIVSDSSSVLQTDSLKYDLLHDIVYIIGPTNIKSDSTQIYCEQGYFNYETQVGEFYKNLEIKTESRIILAENVEYDRKRNIYTLTGKPTIDDDTSHAKADTIIYAEKEEEVDLIGNAYYKSDERELKSQYIKYNLKTDEYETIGGSEVVDESGRILNAEKLYRNLEGTDIAESKVNLRDNKEKVTLKTDILESDNESNSYKAFSTSDIQPLLIKDLDGSNFLLQCDTLSYIKIDSTEYYEGINNISFLNKEFSGRSGNLLYSPVDTNYIFTDDPILWTDSIQITGDSIVILFQNDEISRMDVFGNAFMIMQGINGTYDQVKGDQLSCNFSNNSINEIIVDDNVEMVYFMYENNELTGVNHSFCGGLVFTFVHEEVKYLRFKDKPNSTFSKGGILNPEVYNLQGFLWSGEKKPNKLSFKR
jgi:lipopolysaccharide export system protein LptA